MTREAPAGGAARSGATSAPAGGAAADRAAPAERNAPVNKDEATDTTNKSEQKPAVKSTQSDDKMQRDDKRTTDSTRDSGKAGKDMKADSKSTTTTGQAGAGAKLTTEQRTKVTTVIKQQNIQPVTNVNFSISVGTRVPREVRFHPLPAEIITVYPDWRGYEFFLVRNEIIVVNPRTLEIVAVLDA